MKDFLLITFGSSGDVNPFVGLGTELLKRGHRVTLATNPYFKKFIERAGLTFIPIGREDDFLATMEDPDLWHPIKGLRFVIEKGMKPLLRPSYEIVKSFSDSTHGTVVSSLLALGARVAQEKWNLPLVTVHLQPTAFASVEAPPIYSQSNMTRWPRWARRMSYWLAGRMVDRWLSPDFNDFRRELNLAPRYGIFNGWVHSPTLTLGLWPDWFAPPQSDWPPQVRLTGFPLYDARGVDPLPSDLEAFLNAGPAPIVFTAGSAMRQARGFFAESLAACRELGSRGIFLTQFQEQIPAALPPSVQAFGYIPFSQVLPRAAAFVHHGGIGTTSQAMACGVPQLIMPLSHDQPDNAARAMRLGIARVIPPEQYQSKRVAMLLKELTSDPDFKTKCQDIQRRLEDVNAIAETCRLIESISSTELS